MLPMEKAPKCTILGNNNSYAEQISHHPPISYMYLTGPNDLYTYNAFFQLKANAGLNGVRNINKGKRKIIFKDG